MYREGEKEDGEAVREKVDLVFKVKPSESIACLNLVLSQCNGIFIIFEGSLGGTVNDAGNIKKKKNSPLQ